MRLPQKSPGDAWWRQQGKGGSLARHLRCGGSRRSSAPCQVDSAPLSVGHVTRQAVKSGLCEKIWRYNYRVAPTSC